jgi:hypothetical protein
MKMVHVRSEFHLLPIGTLSVDPMGEWHVLYDHYENDETRQYVEIWLPMKQERTIAGEDA